MADFLCSVEHHSVSMCSIAKKMPLTDPSTQYQNLKVIQKTVRVPASVYTSSLGALSVYQQPVLYGVNWNQMSDRSSPHYQRITAPTRGSSTKSTITRARPGAGTPGGYGVDIKHNSYDRYLARLKGKGPLRREPTPANYGKPIIFSCVNPVYGGKTMKTNIINDCIC